MRRRFKIVYVMLVMATLLYVNYYFYRLYCYSQLPTTFEDPELGTYSVDYLPFQTTSEGSRLLWLCIPLAVAWTVVIFYDLLKDLKVK